MVTPINKMVEHHLRVSPIVYRYKPDEADLKEGQEMFVVQSMKGENKSYIVMLENTEWSCDCPSFKFRSGVDQLGNCKHIRLIIFLKDNNVEIKEI